jgi:superfamily I DNA/RNA helicase
LSGESDQGWKDCFPSAPLESLWLEKVRQRFTPEVVVPSEMTVRMPVDRRIEAGLTDYLLDYDQESAVKADLDLPAEPQALTGDFKLNIINGVAGSGKTLILLYRLRLLYHLYPGKRFLVLTHNRPLSRDMEGRFARLEGRTPDNIEWRTFNGWCYHHWPSSPKWIEPLKLEARKNLLEKIWRAHLQNSSISAQMFRDEVDWVKDQPPMTQEEYLSANRRGRGFGLNAEQRQRMYIAMQAYQLALEERRARDWGDVPQQIWQFVESGQVRLPEYDVILMDEAQFFAPIWIHLIQKALNPNNGHLFLVADPTQGFLGRGTSWKSLGLEARGRTHLLRHSYRSTREIMQFATLLYRLRLTDEKDDDILVPDLLNMPSGAFPEIIPLTSPQDEITRLANEVADFVKKGYPKRHLLLFHTDGHGVRSLIQAIDDRLGKNAAFDPKDTYPGDYIRVTTLNAGAGLESPIVFLAGLRQLFEEEQSLRLSDDEREVLIRDNTRKLYMAATRAGQRLVLTYAGDLPGVLIEALKGQLILGT